MHQDNSYITLTYSDEHLPENDTLVKKHHQDFLKRLRKKFHGQKILYYMCGEYGDPDKTERPHYHFILFNLHFPDRTFWTLRNGYRVYRSATLEKLWTKGNSEIGSVTFNSAGYVARYVLKKQNGDLGKKLYEKTGRISPYVACSLKPAIGKKWYDKFAYSDLWPHDYAVLPDGRQTTVPKYYRRLLATENPELAETLKAKRIEKATSNPDNSEARLKDREKCKTKQIEKLQRNL